jgi:hypothetical protein
MAISHKYRTFDQLLEDVSIDFSSQALEGMVEPQQLIKVAIRVNYDLGLRIHRTKEDLLEVEQYRTSTRFYPLRIKDSTSVIENGCPNINAEAVDIAEIKDGFLLTNFTTGKVYLNYQGAMEDEEGNLLVLDHPYCNEYYEYALKERMLENMLFEGENVSQKLTYIQGKLRAARNNALGFINTPDFKEMQKIWSVNRKAQYHNYYDMFRSHPPVR